MLCGTGGWCFVLLGWSGILCYRELCFVLQGSEKGMDGLCLVSQGVGVSCYVGMVFCVTGSCALCYRGCRRGWTDYCLCYRGLVPCVTEVGASCYRRLCFVLQGL